jgi:acyl-CoA synthetase (NDP forming)
VSKSQLADLKRFFGPASVALIGATDDTTKFGGRVLRFLLEGGYRGNVYPVNPRAETVRGLPAFKSARDLPEPVDHVGIAVPADRVLDSIKDCAVRGAKFATIFTAGFGETMAQPALALQAEIVRTANAAGIRVMGPNCNGMVSFVERFVFTATSAVAPPLPPAGRVGVVSQSGGAGQINVMWRAQQAGVSISHQVSCGNECDLELFDFINFMVDDPHTDVVLVVAEKIVDGRKLIDVANRAAKLKKPIVIQKFGRSEAAQHAALYRKIFEELREPTSGVRRIVEAYLEPLTAQIDHSGEVPAIVWDALRRYGLLGMRLSEEYGGAA